MRMGPHLGMSLGLSQSMEQRLTQIQKLSPEQRLELRQKQAVHFAESLNRLRDEGPASDEDMLEATIGQITTRIPLPKIAEAVNQLLGTSAARQAIMKYRHGLARKDPDILRAIVSDMYYPPGGLVEWADGSTATFAISPAARATTNRFSSNSAATVLFTRNYFLPSRSVS